MWKSLHDQYTATATFSRATVHTVMIQVKCSGNSARIYVAKWESISAKFSLMDAPMDEEISLP